jgi:hypothetical protein
VLQWNTGFYAAEIYGLVIKNYGGDRLLRRGGGQQRQKADPDQITETFHTGSGAMKPLW